MSLQVEREPIRVGSAVIEHRVALEHAIHGVEHDETGASIGVEAVAPNREGVARLGEHDAPTADVPVHEVPASTTNMIRFTNVREIHIANLPATIKTH